MRRSFAVALVSSVVVSFLACSSDPKGSPDAGATDASALPDASLGPDARPGPDAAIGEDARPPADGGTDAPSDAALVAVSGTLDVRAAGSLPNTVKLGTFTVKRGSAQYRARPSGGGVLTVSLGEDPSGVPSRAFEITLHDDDGGLGAAESFAADTKQGLPLRRARVETYQSDGKAWTSDGDGAVVVESFDGASVTLKVRTIGQFGQAPGTDVFVVDGTVTVPVIKLAPTTGTGNLAFSAIENEPISNDAPNMTATGTALTGAATLADQSFPFTNDRRSASFGDTQGGTPRNLRLAFPSGHLPHVGQDLVLSKFDRVTLTYFESATLTGAVGERQWEAGQGTMVVEARTATSLTVRVQDARMQSESPAAKGLFKLDGTLTVAIPQ